MQKPESAELTLETVARKNLAPTFKKLPADLISRSRTQEEVYEDACRHGSLSLARWKYDQMGRSAMAWVEKVKPFAVLEWKDYHEAPSLIEKAKQLLEKKGVQASCIMCDPDFANDMTGRSPGYSDMPTVRNWHEYMGLKLFRTFACHYNPQGGMFIFDNRDARFYLKGKSKHYWNCPPYVVQVTRAWNAKPTHSDTWFCAPTDM